MSKNFLKICCVLLENHRMSEVAGTSESMYTISRLLRPHGFWVPSELDSTIWVTSSNAWPPFIYHENVFPYRMKAIQNFWMKFVCVSVYAHWLLFCHLILQRTVWVNFLCFLHQIFMAKMLSPDWAMPALSLPLHQRCSSPLITSATIYWIHSGWKYLTAVESPELEIVLCKCLNSAA